jgi:hypothetical protein
LFGWSEIITALAMWIVGSGGIGKKFSGSDADVLIGLVLLAGSIWLGGAGVNPVLCISPRCGVSSRAVYAA